MPSKTQKRKAQKKKINNLYEIKDLIHKGSFGSVYRGIRLEDNLEIVIKSVDKNNYNNHDEPIDIRLKREALIPQLFPHKNITQVLDFVDNDFCAYIIYPYTLDNIAFCDMDHKCFIYRNRDSDNLVKIIQILQQVIDAVSWLHSNDVVHRDIKSDNVIVSSENTFLIDFDSAALINDDKYPIVKGLIGTSDYIAPEIIFCLKNIDYKLADIYSLGVMLYVCFNEQKFPFDLENSANLRRIHKTRKPYDSTCIFPEINDLIQKCLSKNPTDRPSLDEIYKTITNIPTHTQ